MRVSRFVLATLVLVLAAAMLAGCAESDLEGTAWRVQRWSDGSSDPADFQITATFGDGRMGGVAAVNSYGGEYKSSGANDFSIDDITRTEMAGPEPAMEAESTFFELLERTRSYRLENEELTFLDGDGRELIVFIPQE